MKFKFVNIFIPFAINFFISHLSAQHSLKVDSIFFESQVIEYNNWLKTVNFNKLLETSTLYISDDKLTLDLISTIKPSSCEELQAAWEKLYFDFNQTHKNKQLLHEKLLETFSLLTEVSPDSLQINISCGNDDLFGIKIYGDKLGRVRLIEHLTETQGKGTFMIPIVELQNVNTGFHLDSLNRELTIRKVRLAISDFLYNKWYKGKGTPFLYNVRVDTTSSYFNEFSWEFTHLSNEVLRDQGYYEFHKVNVQIQDANGFIEVNWKFTGKFGSGILFPPRKHDYKLMESYYKEEEREYEYKLFKMVNDHLRKLI